MLRPYKAQRDWDHWDTTIFADEVVAAGAMAGVRIE